MLRIRFLQVFEYGKDFALTVADRPADLDRFRETSAHPPVVHGRGRHAEYLRDLSSRYQVTHTDMYVVTFVNFHDSGIAMSDA